MSTITLEDMRDALTAVKPIVQGAEDAFRVYHLKDGQLRAQNRNMRAGIPVMFDDELVVPAGEFEKMIRALTKNPEVTAGKNQILFKTDKMRLTLPRLSGENLSHIDTIKGDAVDLDQEFFDKIKILSQLLEDSPTPDWQQSIICVGGKMISTYKGHIMMTTDYKPFEEEDIKCLLPTSVIKFLLNKKTPPEEMLVTEAQVQFNWPDDSWVISSLVTGKVPNKMFKLLETITEPEFELTSEHREAIQSAQAMGAETIQFLPEGIKAKLPTGDMEVDTVFPTGAEGKASYAVRELSMAMEVADKFNFTTYPGPASFVGEQVSGLVAGRVV